ncbi:ATP-binding protein [Streptomyces atratus]|uniref:ATP-binding protein n=1 Tax=Streptomyces atratus TaxID=1893 RepID=UPI002255EA59|nr:ATP-binding protein [Streptomyces atratus]MCX5346097.1 ATP-binding protein [Streptomyces atratus]
MPCHFVDLDGANALPTGHFQMTARIVRDLVAHAATGVVHGPAGTGKTFAVEAALEALDALPAVDRPQVCLLTFPSRPTMRMIADQLLRELTGADTPTSRNRFDLTTKLVGLLATPMRLVVVDEAQRLNGDCIELLRHLHDHPKTRFALLYVGGDGCWEVLSKEPMLRSRVFRRLPFSPLAPAKVPALMRRYHPIYADAPDELLVEVDNSYGHGTMRDWAVFTHTAAALCAEQNLATVDETTVHNAYSLLGGGLRD